MYSEYYRDRLENPNHYDRMIALILTHNQSCKDIDWAANAINHCIDGALAKGDCATGMCVAYAYQPVGSISMKVRIHLEPLAPIALGEAIRAAHTR